MVALALVGMGAYFYMHGGNNQVAKSDADKETAAQAQPLPPKPEPPIAQPVSPPPTTTEPHNPAQSEGVVLFNGQNLDGWTLKRIGEQPTTENVAQTTQQPVAETPTQPAAKWRMTGEYPLIAGKWQKGAVKITVQQNGNKFVANVTFKDKKGVERHWREEGTISNDGEITTSDKSQTLRTGKVDPDGKTIHGRNKNGQDFAWELSEPYDAGP